MRAARADANQAEIVKALRQAGCSVQHLHTIGAGCPDILVGLMGSSRLFGFNGPINVLMEIKDSAKPPSAQKLTPDEVEWHLAWRGQVCVVNSIDQALAVIQALRIGA